MACCAVTVTIMFVAITLGTAIGEQTSIERNLPSDYTGEFRWYGDSVSQLVEIRILAVGRPDANRIEAIGCGRYDAYGRITRIRVRMVIEVPSLDVEIWEFNPVSGAFFTIDGSHKGKLVGNLQSIDAEWTTRTTGQKGRLRLRASGPVTCAPQVAAN